MRLGLGNQFFGGDIDAALRYQLAPSGVTLEHLRAKPGRRADTANDAPPEVRGVGRVPHAHRQDRAVLGDVPVRRPSPLPSFEEPGISPRSRPDLAERFPLVLTCAKSLWFCESQHRNIASVRSKAREPQVEIHPDAARACGITVGDWVQISTPNGSVRARAKLNPSLHPTVVCGQHGWWQACPDLDLSGYPPYGPESANLNLILRQDPSDPISGNSPLRASMCEIVPL